MRADELHLEYTKRDRWFGTKQGIAAVDLRLSDIARVALRNGPVTKGIEIQTKNLMCLRDFPYAEGRPTVLFVESGKITRIVQPAGGAAPTGR